MNSNEILNEIADIGDKTIIMEWNYEPIPSIGRTAKWRIFLHWDLDYLKKINKNIRVWKCDDLNTGLKVAETILYRNGYEKNEVNSNMDKAVKELNLQSRNEIYFCALSY